MRRPKVRTRTTKETDLVRMEGGGGSVDTPMEVVKDVKKRVFSRRVTRVGTRGTSLRVDGTGM